MVCLCVCVWFTDMFLHMCPCTYACLQPACLCTCLFPCMHFLEGLDQEFDIPLSPSLAFVSSRACWTCCGWVMSTWRRVRRGEQVLLRSLAPSPDRSSTVANTSKPSSSRFRAAAFPKPESQPGDRETHLVKGIFVAGADKTGPPGSQAALFWSGSSI